MQCTSQNATLRFELIPFDQFHGISIIIIFLLLLSLFIIGISIQQMHCTTFSMFLLTIANGTFLVLILILWPFYECIYGNLSIEEAQMVIFKSPNALRYRTKNMSKMIWVICVKNSRMKNVNMQSININGDNEIWMFVNRRQIWDTLKIHVKYIQKKISNADKQL